MNIQRQLKKIHRDLSEIAFEMETSASKPRERKGAYDVPIYYPDEDIEIRGRLRTTPILSRKLGAWIAEFEIENKYSRKIDPQYFVDGNITAYWNGEVSPSMWELFDINKGIQEII